MQTQVQKWGNSLAFRIPKALAQAAGMEPGTQVTVSVVKGKLVIERVPEREFTLDELLAGVTKGNLHAEANTGNALGRERW